MAPTWVEQADARFQEIETFAVAAVEKGSLAEVPLDLLLTLVALVAWQGVVFVPSSGAVFRTCWWRSQGQSGGGPNWLAPGLGMRAAVSGLPFEMTPELLLCRTSLDRIPATGAGRAERRLRWSSIARIEARGGIIRVDGSPFFRAVNDDSARELASRLESLRSREAADRSEAIVAWIEEAFDVGALREAYDALKKATRVLGWTSWLSLALLLGVLPPAVLVLGDDAPWRLLLPALGAAHGANVLALAMAEQRLSLPSGAAGRLAVAVLYPPAAICGAATMASMVLARFHPAALAMVLLRPEKAARFARPFLGEAQHPPFARAGEPPADAEEARIRANYWLTLRNALATAAERCGIPASALVAGAIDDDPAAWGFCPVCGAGYREGFNICAECGVPVRRDACS